MKSKLARRLATALTAASMALASIALVAGPAAADTNKCPAGGTGNPASYPYADVTTSDSGNTRTYTLVNSVDRSTGDPGIAGLIKLCVYVGAGNLPTSATPLALGADGSAWIDPSSFDNFDFGRPDGNPSNILLDGTVNEDVGSATWDSGIPDQTVLLHVNDPEWCNSTYSGNPNTCFALPSSGNGCEVDCTGGEGAALTIDKTASGAYTTSYTWDITKSACLHGVTPCKQKVEQVGGSVTFDYAVTVTRSAAVDGQETVSGSITVGNTNNDGVDHVTVTDLLSDGTHCAVTDAADVTVPSGGTSFDYSCTTNVGSLTNTATVSWPTQTLPDDGVLPGSSGLDSLPVTVDPVTHTVVDDCTHVTDPNSPTPPLPADTCATHTYNYSKTFTVGAGCTDYKNTATETTDDTSTAKTADATVTVCGPARTGALTIGFWKTTNGQNLVKTYCGGTGTSGLAYYLAHLGGISGPFSNATSSTSCSALATYVYNLLNGANAKNMNSMLKAQMLGTALDVWFSGPGWTSTTISKVKPPSGFLSNNYLGTFNMDTTAVCPMVDNLSTGSATCKNNLPSTDAVAAGAVPSSPMAMQAILDFAATTPSPFNGLTSASNWYGGNSTKEEILKNIFDQFNNQDAFGSF
jgi:hypothetical protein